MRVCVLGTRGQQSPCSTEVPACGSIIARKQAIPKSGAQHSTTFYFLQFCRSGFGQGSAGQLFSGGIGWDGACGATFSWELHRLECPGRCPVSRASPQGPLVNHVSSLHLLATQCPFSTWEKVDAQTLSRTGRKISEGQFCCSLWSKQ